jgi:cohesin loading factor subunit SCC2
LLTPGLVRLRDGRSIRTVSALLLHLVQTSVHDVHMQAGQLAKARQQAEAMRRQDSMKDASVNPDFLTEDDHNV